MANLKKYFYNGLRAGSQVDLYLLKGKVGVGTVNRLDALGVDLHAAGEALGFKFDTQLQIIMKDESVEGRCELAYGTNPSEPKRYQDEQGKLRFDVKEEIAIYSESKWTWVWLQHPTQISKRGWIGIWPRSESLSDDDLYAVSNFRGRR